MQTTDQILASADERGRLGIAGIHDAQLTSFAYRSREHLSFDLAGANGEATNITMVKPILLNIDSMWEGSIVDSVFAWRSATFPETMWSEPENGWNALLKGRQEGPSVRQEAARLAARYPDAVLLIVACSYGGDWSVLGQSLTIGQTKPGRID